jgi:hypothetical protein
MQDYSQILNSLDPFRDPTNGARDDNVDEQKHPRPAERKEVKLFNIDDFVKDVQINTINKNSTISKNSTTISAYDITSNCSREVIFKLLNYPVDNRVPFLPLGFRAALGTAVHEYIQSNSSVFTENEISIRVPSLKLSCRIDNLINDNVLIDIKSVPFTDYNKIIKNHIPRDKDFYQLVLYRWMLHNHLEEMKQQPIKSESNPYGIRTPPPKLNKYNITHFQLIYVAHDMISSECDNLTEAVSLQTSVKRMLNSRYNQMYFISQLTIDLTTIDMKPYEDYIVNKINTLNKYIQNEEIPPMDDSFVDTSCCFFCLFNKVCKEKR